MAAIIWMVLSALDWVGGEFSSTFDCIASSRL